MSRVIRLVANIGVTAGVAGLIGLGPSWLTVGFVVFIVAAIAYQHFDEKEYQEASRRYKELFGEDLESRK